MKKKLTGGKGWSFQSKNQPKREKPSLPPDKQRLHVRFERRAGGKGMTIVEHGVLTEVDRKALAKKLKSKLGIGGSIRDDGVELQGECMEKTKEALKQLGYGVK